MNIYTKLSKPIIDAVIELNMTQGIFINDYETINSKFDINAEHEKAVLYSKSEVYTTSMMLPLTKKEEIKKSCEYLVNHITLERFIQPSAPIRAYAQILYNLTLQSTTEEYKSAMKSATTVEYISEKKDNEGLLLWCHFCIEDLCRSIGPRVL